MNRLFICLRALLLTIAASHMFGPALRARASDPSVPEPDAWACDAVETKELAICNGDVPADRPGPWQVWNHSIGGWTGSWKSRAAAVQSCERSNRLWKALFHEPGPEDCSTATCAACPPGDSFDRARSEMVEGLTATLALDVLGRAEGALVDVLATTISKTMGVHGAWASSVRRLDAIRRETERNARQALRGALSAPQNELANLLRGGLQQLDDVNVASGMVLARGLRSSPPPWTGGLPPWGGQPLGVAAAPGGAAGTPDARARSEQVLFTARDAGGVKRVVVMNSGSEPVRVRVRALSGAQQEVQLGPTTVEYVDLPGATYEVLRLNGWSPAGVAVELVAPSTVSRASSTGEPTICQCVDFEFEATKAQASAATADEGRQIFMRYMQTELALSCQKFMSGGWVTRAHVDACPSYAEIMKLNETIRRQQGGR